MIDSLSFTHCVTSFHLKLEIQNELFAKCVNFSKNLCVKLDQDQDLTLSRTPLLLSSRTYTKFLGRIHIKLLIMHHIMFTLISHGSLQLSRNVFSSSWDCAISMANRSSLIHSEWHERKRSR